MRISTDDTIVAISTPLGRSGLGIVRLSGPDAARIGQLLIGRAEPLVSRYATFARFRSTDLSKTNPTSGGDQAAAVFAVGDQVVVTYFQGPHSSTGDDVVEVSAHGSPVVLEGILRAAMAGGARLAQPGEFTLRAFINGKLDLVQAEAVADLIDAVTPLQARAAFDQLEGTLTARITEIEAALFDLIARLEASLDFPEEGYHFVERDAAATEASRIVSEIDRLLSDAGRGRILREGAQVAIVGTPNVGKSSLFNALLNASRAIVTPIPGTTRDLLTERADIHGIAVSLVDTAGIRDACDEVEQEGIARARQAITVADLTVLVLDRSRPLAGEDHALLGLVGSGRPALVVVNKADLPAVWDKSAVAAGALDISIRDGTGLDHLTARIASALGAGPDTRDQPRISNVRHLDLLVRARASLTGAIDAIRESNGHISEEFVLADLQDAASSLQEITGQRTTEDLLSHIFARFCIGK